MKTKVQIDNKSRILKLLDPIHPAIQEVDFQLNRLSESERQWVATHYDSCENTVYIHKEISRNQLALLTVEQPDENHVIEAIQAHVSSLAEKKTAKASKKKTR